MLKLYLGKAHVICWIVIGSLVQAQEFSTTVVKEGEDAIIECGLQTKVEEGYLRWETMTNGSPVDLAYDIRDGKSNCNDGIINCTLYANGSIQLESVSKEDGARYYRCLRGDDNGYDYYSDHRLSVLSKESPSISQSPTSAIAFKASRKGIVHSYGEQVCEDDVDGNLPVVCYPPSGIIVDREYETIQCNCTDSDGLMDSVTFPVTSITHWVHPGWKKAFISLLVISILIILVLICCYLYMKLKKSKAYHPENLAVLKGSKRRKEDDKMAADPEEFNLIESGAKDKQISDLEDEIGKLKATLNNSQTELTQRNEEVSSLTDQLKQKETQETEMKNKLEEQNQKINTIQTELTEREREVSNLKEQLEQKDTQETEMKNKLAEQNEKINTIQTELTEREREVSNLKEQLEQKDTQETEMKNKLEEQNEKISKIEKELAVKEAENNGLEKRLEDKQQQISSLEKILADNRAFFQQQRETASKQDGKKYQEDDNNSEFDKNSSPSEKETKEEGTPRKGKKKDPERRLTQRGFPNMPPQETPGKNNQNDEDVETDIDDSYTTEDNKNLDKDETDFSKSKGCSDDTGPNVSRAFKEYRIDDKSVFKGFNLAFTCDGTDMRIVLRINKDSDGIICQFEFKNGKIIPSYRGNSETAIGFTKGTKYHLTLGNKMRVLSLFQEDSAQGNECVQEFGEYDFVHLSLLCIYKSDTCSVSILSHLGLSEMPTPADDLN